MREKIKNRPKFVFWDGMLRPQILWNGPPTKRHVRSHRQRTTGRNKRRIRPTREDETNQNEDLRELEGTGFQRAANGGGPFLALAGGRGVSPCVWGKGSAPASDPVVVVEIYQNTIKEEAKMYI